MTSRVRAQCEFERQLAGALLVVVAICAACGEPSDGAGSASCDGASCTTLAPEPSKPDQTPAPSHGVSKDAGAASPDGSGDGPVAPPSASDGIKNGLETDVDCGGPDALTPRCAAHRSCVDASDCTTGLCAGAGAMTSTCLLAPSCTGAAGTTSCGLGAGGEDCCTSLPVPGGSYNRGQDPAYPAKVSSFRLDKYEITVGRIRAFFEATGGSPKSSPPAPGAGAHPKVPNSGWRSSFDVRLPASWAEIDARLGAAGCAEGGDNTDGGAATWTHSPGSYEDLPITCADWYTLFAFCAWDGGRLPTDAEWGYAAAGGSEDREYAWGGTIIQTWPTMLGVLSLTDPIDGIVKYTFGGPFRGVDPVTGSSKDGPAHMTAPGRATGYGKWGHADLTGNVLEFLLDRTPVIEGACNDCANVDWPNPPQDQIGLYPGDWVLQSPPQDESDYPDARRSLRGGSWDVHVPYVYWRYEYLVSRTYYAAGARCARD